MAKRATTKEPRKPFHEAVAEKLIEQLKQGTAPWQKPWKAGTPGTFLPTNPVTGNRYNGINIIQLMSQGFEDPRWMTYNQAESQGWQVRKGEKGTPVQYWKFSEMQDKEDENGKPIIGKDGKPEQELVQLDRPRVFWATVFNAQQIDGIPERQVQEATWDKLERAETMLRASGAQIYHDQSDRAFYRPSTDRIHMPDRGLFDDAGKYYATALHELGHWTGHPSRLDRDLSHPFGSEGYAREELRAEISSLLMGDELGLGHDPGQHVAYVKSWIRVLEEDPMEIFRAAADAEKVQKFVLGLEREYLQSQAHVNTNGEDHAEILEVLEQQHATANPGYSSLESWKNLERVAAGQGITATLRWSQLDEYGPDIILEYRDRAGALLPIQTELHSGDGKAVTNLDGQRIPGTGYTSDEGWQRDALMSAIATHQRNQTNKEDQMEQPRAEQAPVTRQYLHVPFKDKDEAKSLGARWDGKQRSWYINSDVDAAPFEKWRNPPQQETVSVPDVGAEQAAATPAERPALQPGDRQYLAVPYGERGAAKAMGAQWDKGQKSWYITSADDATKFQRWDPSLIATRQEMSPTEEFALACRDAGLKLDGEPIMDGQRHRVALVDDKPGEKSGVYIGHLDGHPAGYIKNHRTGVELKWKSTGQSISDEERAKIHAEAAEKLQQREAERTATYEEQAQRALRQISKMAPLAGPTPYLTAKDIPVHRGIYTNQEGKATFIPAYDADGKVWTIQAIQEDGTKRFLKDSRKEGCFHVIGGLEQLAKAPALVIGEGYATMGTATEALGYSTVAAFDSGNIKAVATALRERYPDKPVLIVGDDDVAAAAKSPTGINAGRTKAEEAAKAVGGIAVFPVFAPGEAKNGLSDFNDLAKTSVLGMDAVTRQLKTAERQAHHHHINLQVNQQQVQERTPRTAKL